MPDRIRQYASIPGNRPIPSEIPPHEFEIGVHQQIEAHQIQTAHGPAHLTGGRRLVVGASAKSRQGVADRQSGLAAHFRAIAATTDLPVLLYDIPKRTGRKIDTSTLIELGKDVPNIVGVKDAAADPGQTAIVIDETPADFEVYSGDDPMTLPLLAVGAVGAIGVATHWCAPDHVAMFDAWDAGDAAGARAHNARQLESYRFESSDTIPNPLPAKAMLRTLGHAVGEARLPMGPAPAELENRAREVYDRLVSSRG